MEFWIKVIITGLAGYLIGSISTAIIVAYTSHIDIRKYGSGNAGATNATRVLGAKKGSLVFIGDALKGIIAVMIGQFIFAGFDFSAGAVARLFAGIMAMLGHIFPVYFKFKGGKGVMTGAAVFAAVDYRAFLIIFSIFLVVFLLTRYVSLGSILAALSIGPVFFMFYPNEPVLYIVGSVVGIALIFTHRANIVRLVKGQESKFKFRAKGTLHDDKDVKK